MNQLKKYLMLIGIHSCLLGAISAQRSVPVKFSIFSESTSIPFTDFLNTPIHPGFQIGTEFAWKESKLFRLYPAVNLGYMFHRKLFQGIFLNVELGVDLKLGPALTLKGNLGAGYLHTFATRQEYQLKDGQYISEADRGNARFIPSIAVGMGYKLNPRIPSSPELFFLYQSWLEFPYSPGFIPVMSHVTSTWE